MSPHEAVLITPTLLAGRPPKPAETPADLALRLEMKVVGTVGEFIDLYKPDATATARAIRELAAKVAAMEAEIEVRDRKHLHGCTDAYCPICDGPRGTA